LTLKFFSLRNREELDFDCNSLREIDDGTKDVIFERRIRRDKVIFFIFILKKLQ